MSIGSGRGRLGRPSAERGHSSFGRSQQSSIPLPSGSFIHTASAKPSSAAPAIVMPPSMQRRTVRASTCRVGKRMATWCSPVLPGAGGEPPRLCQVLRAMRWW